MRRGSDSHERPPAEYPTSEDIRRLFERYRTALSDPLATQRRRRWEQRAEQARRFPSSSAGRREPEDTG